jgi:chromosomal replication initiation ATPase DnaA
MTAQLPLGFEPLTAWGEDSFFISASNEAAVQYIGTWPDWDGFAAILYGPPKCGKSHLARIWQKRTGGDYLQASQLSEKHLADCAFRTLVLDDFEPDKASKAGETALFHLLNLSRERRFHVLILARTPPGLWPVALPDLRSRLRSFPVLAMHEADEELLAAVLLKHFADRQLQVSPDVVRTITARMERSFSAAQELAATLDRAALAEKKPLTKLFVSRFLEGSR